MPWRALLNGREVSAEVAGRRPELAVRVNGLVHAVDPGEAGSVFRLSVDGRSYSGWRYVAGDDIYIRLFGKTFILTRASNGSAAAANASSQSEMRADMPGVVVAVHCVAGQPVSRGDKLITLESMKLQATLVASHDGVIQTVHVSAESTFERGALLVSFASAQASSTR